MFMFFKVGAPLSDYWSDHFQNFRAASLISCLGKGHSKSLIIKFKGGLEIGISGPAWTLHPCTQLSCALILEKVLCPIAKHLRGQSTESKFLYLGINQNMYAEVAFNIITQTVIESFWVRKLFDSLGTYAVFIFFCNLSLPLHINLGNGSSENSH